MPGESTLNLVPVVAATIFGAVFAGVLFLIERSRQEKRSLKILSDIDRLGAELATLKRQLGDIRQDDDNDSTDGRGGAHPHHRKRNNTDKVHHRLMSNGGGGTTLLRRRMPGSGTTTTSSDGFLSAIDTDLSDSEFYDTNDSWSAYASRHDLNSMGTDDQGDSGGGGECDLDKTLAEHDRKLLELTSSDSSLTCSLDLNRMLTELEQLNTKFHVSPRVLWRIGRLHHKLSKQQSNLVTVDGDTNETVDAILAHLNRGVAACQQAIDLLDDVDGIAGGGGLEGESGQCHKYMAILVGARCQYATSTMGSVADGGLFRRHLEAAMRLLPTDAYVFHLYGRYWHRLATLNWYERQAASFLMEVPPDSAQRALDGFLRAHELLAEQSNQPHAHSYHKYNHVMLGKCLWGRGDTEGAERWLREAQQLVAGDATEDEELNSQITELLKQMAT